MATTPMLCFRVDRKLLRIYTEDYAKNRNLVATCPDETQLNWLMSSLSAYHKGVPVFDWDEPWIAE